MKQNNVQFHWTEKEILKAMEENMHYHMTYFAKYTPALRIAPEHDVTVVRSDILDDTYNYILGARFTKENAESRVKSVLEHLKIPVPLLLVGRTMRHPKKPGEYSHRARPRLQRSGCRHVFTSRRVYRTSKQYGLEI